jgi:hypothetical protein
MTHALDIALVVLAVSASAAYVVYALGPKRIKNVYSRLATKYFGLRAAKWFAPSKHSSCNSCPSHEQHKELLDTERRKQ